MENGLECVVALVPGQQEVLLVKALAFQTAECLQGLSDRIHQIHLD